MHEGFMHACIPHMFKRSSLQSQQVMKRTNTSCPHALQTSHRLTATHATSSTHRSCLYWLWTQSHIFLAAYNDLNSSCSVAKSPAWRKGGCLPGCAPTICTSGLLQTCGVLTCAPCWHSDKCQLMAGSREGVNSEDATGYLQQVLAIQCVVKVPFPGFVVLVNVSRHATHSQKTLQHLQQADELCVTEH